MDTNTKFSEISWDDLSTRDKINGLIGWTIVAAVGVVTYKLGKRAGAKL